MSPTVLRLGLLVVALAAFAPPAPAQITWNPTYSGSHWSDSTPLGGSTVGQLRRDSVTAATTYLSTVLDGRGTVNFAFSSFSDPLDGTLAFFGPEQITGINGSFQNGGMYQSARTNQRPFGGVDASGEFNFGHAYNYVGQTPNVNNFDMVTVALHELTHGLGFTSFTFEDGSGLGFAEPPNPSIYAGFDRYLQRGNGAGGGLFNTNIGNSGFGSFTGQVSTLINGNNATTGLFFGGQYTREVRGNPAPLFAPNPWEDGSSIAHVNDNAALMNPNVTPNTVRLFQNYEIAMMLDIGWNVYNWNDTDGNWSDGVGNVAQSRWRSDQGIIFNGAANGNQTFNTFANPGQAPVLPVSGQVTSNIILNFGGGGTALYTATNDLSNVRVSRLNLNSTSSQTNTITGGTLQFGVNSDNTASVLTPKIVQQNTGAFNIDSNIIITNTTGAPGSGWSGLTVDGAGTGTVRLGGVISSGGDGTGTLTKAGTFTLELRGNSANSYTGVTTVNAGTLLLNKSPGQNAFAGNVTVNTTGTLRLAGNDQVPDLEIVRLSGGTLSTGATTGFSDSVGLLELTSSSTIDLGTGIHALTFNGINGTPAGTLTIVDWTGVTGGVGTAGKVLFSNIGDTPNTTYASFLTTVNFQTFGAGATFFTTAELGVYELVPVPEPATVLAIAFATLGAGAFVRRRFRQSLVISQ